MVQGHLLEGMWSTAIRHTEMVWRLATVRVAVSSTAQFVLGRSPSKAFWVDVVDEMLIEFQEQAEQCSSLVNSGTRVCDLILGPP
jgi:hypothetical protein